MSGSKASSQELNNCVLIFDASQVMANIKNTPYDGDPRLTTIRYEGVRVNLERVLLKISTTGSDKNAMASSARSHMVNMGVQYADITSEIIGCNLDESDKSKLLDTLLEIYNKVMDDCWSFLNAYYYRCTGKYLASANLDDWR